MKNQICKTFFFFLLICFSACQQDTTSEHSTKKAPLFRQLSPAVTGLSFFNFIREDHYHNIFNFDYMYNGAGLSVGDVNNDGLSDIYFTGNVADNKLFLNQGGFKFKDVTAAAGVAGAASWSNGTTMVDINNDGFLDIYVCRSYFPENPDMRRNLLYINNQNGTFTEQAKAYGIDDVGHSVQATFFDADNDGDLDLFVANHPEGFHIKGRERYALWQSPPAEESNTFYRNNGNNTFTDITQQAGLLDYAFSLGIIAQDFNTDGYTDIFISNDYDQPDQYFVNNGDGTFSNQVESSFKHLSNFGMGVDAGDINNDGFTDLVTVDMLAEDNYREKTQMGSMAPEAFWIAVEWGYHYQYMRNSMHLNNGNGSFSEIGQMAGIHRTDWSWAPLLADFDNDGYKDLFISNGFRRDSRNKDIRTKNDRILAEKRGEMTPQDIINLLEAIPSTKVKNYLFHNNGDYTFSNISEEGGIAIPSFSNGAAYADFDNDGDLDLVVNNLLDTVFLFQNNSIENKSGNYLRIKLKGSAQNINGMGATVNIYYDGQQQVVHHSNTRGYLSSVEFPIHFGLGATDVIDRLEITWPDHKKEVLQQVKVNQELVLDYKNAQAVKATPLAQNQMFEEVQQQVMASPFQHEENLYDDYMKQILLPHKMSQFGPCIAVGDVNNDGLEDFYIGGAKEQDGALYQQSENGFQKTNTSLWAAYTNQEEVGAHFFDADNDGDLDLYIVCGGNEAEAQHSSYKDRIHINDGKGNFSNTAALPDIKTSGSVVTSADIDNDGDLDLFVGGRHTPGAYPSTPRSYLLENQNGKFVDITNKTEGLGNAGMITSAMWIDLHNDKFPELVVAGEWMPVRVFDNQAGQFTEVTEVMGLADSEGWWNSLAAADFDGDGDMDIVAGNLGKNYKYQASAEKPFHLYSQDFDKNGSLDIVLAFENNDGQFPVRGRQCSSEQIPEIKNKFPTYNAFGASKLQDIYGDPLQKSAHYQVKTFASSILINNNNKSFTLQALPSEAQFAPVNGIIVDDFDNDQQPDLLIAGNLYVSEIETGRADAGTGLLLKGKGDGSFQSVPSHQTGFWANRDVKTLQPIRRANGKQLILVGNNNSTMQVFEVK